MTAVTLRKTVTSRSSATSRMTATARMILTPPTAETSRKIPTARMTAQIPQNRKTISRRRIRRMPIRRKTRKETRRETWKENLPAILSPMRTTVKFSLRETNRISSLKRVSRRKKRIRIPPRMRSRKTFFPKIPMKMESSQRSLP